MKLPRVRLTTFMLLVVIVALAAALVDERRRWVVDVVELGLRAKQDRANFDAQAAEISAKLAASQAIRFAESLGDDVNPDTVPIVREVRDGWTVTINVRYLRFPGGHATQANGRRSVRVSRDWRASEMWGGM